MKSALRSKSSDKSVDKTDKIVHATRQKKADLKRNDKIYTADLELNFDLYESYFDALDEHKKLRSDLNNFVYNAVEKELPDDNQEKGKHCTDPDAS